MASSLHRPAPLLRFNPKAPTFCHGFHPRLPSRVLCGLRDGPRKPLWRGRILSTEAIQAVQALKLAKSSSSPSLDQVFQSRIGRLLKADLISVLAELRRQHEWDLALQVFHPSTATISPFFMPIWCLIKCFREYKLMREPFILQDFNDKKKKKS